MPKCFVDEIKYKIKFMIIDCDEVPVLRLNTCEKLKLVK